MELKPFMGQLSPVNGIFMHKNSLIHYFLKKY